MKKKLWKTKRNHQNNDKEVIQKKINLIEEGERIGMDEIIDNNLKSQV